MQEKYDFLNEDFVELEEQKNKKKQYIKEHLETYRSKTVSCKSMPDLNSLIESFNKDTEGLGGTAISEAEKEEILADQKVIPSVGRFISLIMRKHQVLLQQEDPQQGHTSVINDEYNRKKQELTVNKNALENKLENKKNEYLQAGSQLAQDLELTQKVKTEYAQRIMNEKTNEKLLPFSVKEIAQIHLKHIKEKSNKPADIELNLDKACAEVADLKKIQTTYDFIIKLFTLEQTKKNLGALNRSSESFKKYLDDTSLATRELGLNEMRVFNENAVKVNQALSRIIDLGKKIQDKPANVEIVILEISAQDIFNALNDSFTNQETLNDFLKKSNDLCDVLESQISKQEDDWKLMQELEETAELYNDQFAKIVKEVNALQEHTEVSQDLFDKFEREVNAADTLMLK